MPDEPTQFFDSRGRLLNREHIFIGQGYRRFAECGDDTERLALVGCWREDLERVREGTLRPSHMRTILDRVIASMT